MRKLLIERTADRRYILTVTPIGSFSAGFASVPESHSEEELSNGIAALGIEHAKARRIAEEAVAKGVFFIDVE